MDNVKKHIFLYLSILFFIFYLVYILNDYKSRAFLKSDKEIIYYQKKRIDSFLLTHKKIDVLILGGSNASLGISAEILSKKSNKIFYNLTLFAEGFNNDNYIKYLKLTTPDSIKNKVQLIVYSSNIFFSEKGRFDNKNAHLHGDEKPFTIMPELSIFSWLNKKYILKLKNIYDNLPPYSNVEYGDYAFGNYPNNFNPSDNKFINPPLDFIVDEILFKKKEFACLYPNAIFVAVAPTIYNKSTNVQSKYTLAVAHELEKKGINFIAQPPRSNSQEKIWLDNRHLNETGRIIRTKELYEMLDIKFNLSNLIK